MVRDTETSLRFYRNALGLRIVGESLNSGIEQERLNDVSGARVRITARANDLAHWQTIMRGDVRRALPAMQGRAASFISPGVIAIPGAQGFAHAVAVRDPDGHAVQPRGW